MTLTTRARVFVVVLMLVVLGGLMLLDHASRACLEADGHFEASRWTCVPRPPVILQRPLERS